MTSFSAFCLLTAALVVVPGCATRVELVVEEGNYRTYQHPFTEAGAETARQAAARSCANQNRIAVKTSSACSLDRCTTHYQCMERPDAARHKQ